MCVGGWGLKVNSGLGGGPKMNPGVTFCQKPGLGGFLVKKSKIGKKCQKVPPGPISGPQGNFGDPSSRVQGPNWDPPRGGSIFVIFGRNFSGDVPSPTKVPANF